jgi:hypothetical protein
MEYQVKINNKYKISIKRYTIQILFIMAIFSKEDL